MFGVRHCYILHNQRLDEINRTLNIAFYSSYTYYSLTDLRANMSSMLNMPHFSASVRTRRCRSHINTISTPCYSPTECLLT